MNVTPPVPSVSQNVILVIILFSTDNLGIL